MTKREGKQLTKSIKNQSSNNSESSSSMSSFLSGTAVSDFFFFEVCFGFWVLERFLLSVDVLEDVSLVRLADCWLQDKLGVKECADNCDNGRFGSTWDEGVKVEVTNGVVSQFCDDIKVLCWPKCEKLAFETGIGIT